MDMRGKIKVPAGGGGGGNSRFANAGGIPSRIGGGTIKGGGFEGGSRGSGSRGKVGPAGSGFQSSLKGTRTNASSPSRPMRDSGFTERH